MNYRITVTKEGTQIAKAINPYHQYEVSNISVYTTPEVSKKWEQFEKENPPIPAFGFPSAGVYINKDWLKMQASHARILSGYFGINYGDLPLNEKVLLYTGSTQEAKDQPQEEVTAEIPKPVGAFILEQKDIFPTMGANGAYYHYSDVCTMLKRYASQQVEADRKSRWISVKERLPEEKERVLVFSKLKSRLIVYLDKDKWVLADCTNRTFDYVTHWQFLPEPPIDILQEEANQPKQ